jgi:hypothetical protein
VGQAADQAELQALVHLLGLLVVAQDVGGQGQGELCGPAPRVALLKTCSGMISEVEPRVE